MYILKKFHNERFNRINGIIDALAGYISDNINLIGSATLPFPEVCDALKLPATACRVEGFLGARVFPNTFSIDDAEILIAERISHLFEIDHDYMVNAQPHSATQANQAVYQTVLKPGDKVMSISATDGGHISHSVSLTKTNKIVPFPMSENGINYGKLLELVKNEKPKLIIAGGTSFPLEIDYKRLRSIADEGRCLLHADIAHSAPFIAANIHCPAFPYIDFATIDTSKSLRGPKGGILVYKKEFKKKIENSIFPMTQSSPNQGAIIAKACCLTCWRKTDLDNYAYNLVKNSRILSKEIELKKIEIVYGGTQSHLLLLNLSKMNLSGIQAENICSANKILVNRNQVPNDKKTHWEASGIRLSSTVLTILKYTEEDTQILGQQLGLLLSNKNIEFDKIERLIQKYHHNVIQ